MDFQLKDILNTAAPTASLIFASWIFLQLLGQQYSGATERYRSLIAEYRQKDLPKERREQVVMLIGIYKSRCIQMERSMDMGIAAAICFILTLFFATITMLSPALDSLKYLSVGFSLFGLVILMVSAVFLLLENDKVPKVLLSEIEDLPELKEELKKK